MMERLKGHKYPTSGLKTIPRWGFFFFPIGTKMVGKLIPLLLGILISQEMATHTQSRVHSLPTGLLPFPPPPPEKGDHDEGP